MTHGEAARKAMLDGVTEMTRAVAATYGPRGRTVMLDRPGGVLSTKDGVTVAWEVEPANSLRRLGTRVVQEACAKVNALCGDGTTTTAILVHAILRESVKWIAAGAHPVQLAQDLQRVADNLEGADLFDVCCPEPVEDEVLMREVALTASNGDTEVADAIVDALGRVGSEGMIVVEAGKGRGVEIVHKTGMEIEQGWESSDAAGPDGISRHLDAPLVALVDAQLTTMEQVTALLEQATQFPHPLVIVSRGCFGDALKMMVANDRKLERADGATFEVVAVRCPGHVDHMRDHLDDLAALTGATVLDPAVTPLKDFTSGMLGAAQTATVKKESATFVAFEDKFPLIEERVEQLQRVDTGSSHDAEEVRTRIARLTDGFCVMRVGGASDTEIRERRGGSRTRSGPFASRWTAASSRGPGLPTSRCPSSWNSPSTRPRATPRSSHRQARATRSSSRPSGSLSGRSPGTRATNPPWWWETSSRRPVPLATLSRRPRGMRAGTP